MSTFYWFGLPLMNPDTASIHQQRDVESAIELTPELMRRGFDYGGPLMNFPEHSKLELDLPAKKGDLIVMTTRPPLDDNLSDSPHLVIRRTGSPLEWSILNFVRKYFVYCDRRQVTIGDEYARDFKPGCDDRHHILYTAHGAHIDHRHFNFARYKVTMRFKDRKQRSWPADDSRTALYLLHVKEFAENGPDLLVSFGMTGSCGLAWAHILRTRYPELLDGYRFVVAEMEIGTIAQTPVTLSFAEQWNIDIILNREL